MTGRGAVCVPFQAAAMFTELAVERRVAKT
jgi:hypothetical protein